MKKLLPSFLRSEDIALLSLVISLNIISLILAL